MCILSLDDKILLNSFQISLVMIVMVYLVRTKYYGRILVDNPPSYT